MDYACGYKEIGADVLLICTTELAEFGGDPEERDLWLRRARSAGAQVFELPHRLRTLRAYTSAWAASRALHRFSPDVVHVHETGDPRLLALIRKFRTALTIHDPRPHPGHPAPRCPRSWVQERLRNRADLLLVHGDWLRDRVRELMPGARVAAVPLGITMRPRPFSRPADPAVLFFGRLERYKGLDVLLSAMETVWERSPAVRLIIGGTGPEESIVPRDTRITLASRYIPEAEVDSLFAQASVLALPYREASQSGPGGRALARGVPLIVSDAGALPELVPDPSFVVPRGDSEALASAILAWINHGPELRNRVHEFAASTQSWPRVARSTLARFAECGWIEPLDEIAANGDPGLPNNYLK